MLKISNTVELADWEIERSAICSMGNGGQNVNKVSSAIHLRFDIRHFTLPDVYKQRLLALADFRIKKEGVVVINNLSHQPHEPSDSKGSWFFLFNPSNKTAYLSCLSVYSRCAGAGPQSAGERCGQCREDGVSV